jgi:hypothetical protein
MSAHALALLPLTPSRPPPAAEEAGVVVIPPVTAEAEAAGLLLLPLLLLLLLLTIALRQPPAEDECELQNESYVSIVVLCVPVPTVDVTGPGAVGMSNVFDGRNDEREADECGCVDADGGGFCGGAGVAAGAGECIRLDEGGSAGAGERARADAGGDASAGVETDVGAGAGEGVGDGEERCGSTSDGKVAWRFGGKVSREADMPDGCTAVGYGGDVN